MFWWFVAACGFFSADEGLLTTGPDGRRFQLVYTADVHGEIEPCG